MDTDLNVQHLCLSVYICGKKTLLLLFVKPNIKGELKLTFSTYLSLGINLWPTIYFVVNLTTDKRMNTDLNIQCQCLSM